MAETASAVMASPISTLKSRLKRGPAMSREMRVDYALAQAGRPSRRLRPEVFIKFKTELAKLARTGDEKARHFVASMYAQHPELQLEGNPEEI